MISWSTIWGWNTRPYLLVSNLLVKLHHLSWHVGNFSYPSGRYHGTDLFPLSEVLIRFTLETAKREITRVSAVGAVDSIRDIEGDIWDDVDLTRTKSGVERIGINKNYHLEVSRSIQFLSHRLGSGNWFAPIDPCGDAQITTKKDTYKGQHTVAVSRESNIDTNAET